MAEEVLLAAKIKVDVSDLQQMQRVADQTIGSVIGRFQDLDQVNRGFAEGFRSLGVSAKDVDAIFAANEVSASRYHEALLNIIPSTIQTTDSIRGQISALEAAKTAVNGDAVATQRLVTEQQKLISVLEQSGVALTGTEQATQKLKAGSGDAGQAAIQLVRGFREMGSSGRSLQRRIEGLSGNVQIGAAAFGRLAVQSGGVKAAMSAMAASFTGPLGIIAAVTLLVTFLPKLIGLLKGLKGGIGEVGTEAIDAANKIDTFTSSLVQANIKQIESAIEKTQQQINAQVNLAKAGVGNAEVLSELSGVLRALQSSLELAKKELLQLTPTVIEFDDAADELKNLMDELDPSVKKATGAIVAQTEAIRTRINVGQALLALSDPQRLAPLPEGINKTIVETRAEALGLDPVKLREAGDAVADVNTTLKETNSVQNILVDSLATGIAQMAVDWKNAGEIIKGTIIQITAELIRMVAVQKLSKAFGIGGEGGGAGIGAGIGIGGLFGGILLAGGLFGILKAFGTLGGGRDRDTYRTAGFNARSSGRVAQALPNGDVLIPARAINFANTSQAERLGRLQS